MIDQATRIVEQVLARTPAWVRQDLASADAATRVRAEEALSAMIGAALVEQNGVATPETNG